MTARSINHEWEGKFTQEGTHTVQDLLIYAHWCDADPLAVLFTFTWEVGEDEEERDWEIGRDLFLEARREGQKGRGAGDGDVRVYYGMHALILHLRSPEGFCTIQFPRVHMDGFLAATQRIVPQGEEVYDVDEAIKELLK